MPSHQARRESLPANYQFGDAKKTPPITLFHIGVSLSTLHALCQGLDALAELSNRRQRVIFFVRHILIADTVFFWDESLGAK